ncbi:MAG: hypothetical protein LKE92_08010 [Atopobiaceae bacterium]|nr:hypothetical protein [Atopobium sp.]MCH4082043.1 hypothetical protein [Atopobiaceae bacterium]MCI1498692.1 hypothetical protein [Atopobiaceae bacterium]MCI1540394.1 hypothetical protein [Atopobiaceae bacterium]
MRSHGPLTWGADAAQAGCHAVAIEEAAGVARDTELLSAPQHLLDKHYLRKHGPNACYGQGGRSQVAGFKAVPISSKPFLRARPAALLRGTRGQCV